MAFLTIWDHIGLGISKCWTVITLAAVVEYRVLHFLAMGNVLKS